MSRIGADDEADLAEKMYSLFEEMDADGSGVIDKRELQMLLESLDVQLPQKEIIMLFRKCVQSRAFSLFSQAFSCCGFARYPEFIGGFILS